MQADMMKLIAYGKVMDDNSKTLKDYSLKDGDFLVVMISKVLNNWFYFFLSLNHNLKEKKLKMKNQINKRLLGKRKVNQHQLKQQVQVNSNSNNNSHHLSQEGVVQEKYQLMKNR